MIGRRGFLSFLGSLGAAVTLVEEVRAAGHPALRAVTFQVPYCPCGYQFAWPEKWRTDADRRMREFAVPQMQECGHCHRQVTTIWQRPNAAL